MGRFSFKDATVLVTGAGSGMGRELARVSALKGANVILTDISLESIEATAQLVKTESPNSKVLVRRCDVSSREEVSQLKSEVERVFGSELHALFNNAGTFPIHPFIFIL